MCILATPTAASPVRPIAAQAPAAPPAPAAPVVDNTSVALKLKTEGNTAFTAGSFADAVSLYARCLEAEPSQVSTRALLLCWMHF